VQIIGFLSLLIRSWLLWLNHAQPDTVTVAIRNIARVVFKLSNVLFIARPPVGGSLFSVI